MKKAFTIFELIVAMALMVVLLTGSGVVFRMSVKVHRKATATAEISRKLLAIVQQLDQDFDGLRHDGEIFIVWIPYEIEDSGGTTIGYERFDRIVFFANEDLHSYDDSPKVQSNIARISYMIAKPDESSPIPYDPKDRILARVQHVYSADASLPVFPDFTAPFDVNKFYSGEKDLEYDTTTMMEWKNANLKVKEEILTVITDRSFDLDKDGTIGVSGGKNVGAEVDISNAKSLHKLFCEGVGQFIIQDWHAAQQRWWPEIDINHDGIWSDSDLWVADTGDADDDGDKTELNVKVAWGMLYPGDDTLFNYFGKAFKFTFTLYDSQGVFPDGKTFTHIVYLD